MLPFFVIFMMQCDERGLTCGKENTETLLPHRRTSPKKDYGNWQRRPIGDFKLSGLIDSGYLFEEVRSN